MIYDKLVFLKGERSMVFLIPISGLTIFIVLIVILSPVINMGISLHEWLLNLYQAMPDISLKIFIFFVLAAIVCFIFTRNWSLSLPVLFDFALIPISLLYIISETANDFDHLGVVFSFLLFVPAILVDIITFLLILVPTVGAIALSGHRIEKNGGKESFSDFLIILLISIVAAGIQIGLLALFADLA